MTAETTRARKRTGRVPPTRKNSRLSRARRSLAWRAKAISPISSRNTVPVPATSNRPGLRSIAPVKAPFSWPKSSLSTRFSGMAAQFTATKGCVAWGEPRWIARATSSLPVPLSPWMTRGRSEAAARSTVSRTDFMAGSWVTKPSTGCWRSSRTRRAAFSRRSRAFSPAFTVRASISSVFGGFMR